MSKNPTRRPTVDKASGSSRPFKEDASAADTRVERQAASRRMRIKWRQSDLSFRAALGRIPAAAWVCALIALLNGAAWSIITPPFQGRDEPAHFAYVQQLAETGTLPHSATEGGFSPEETLVLEGLHQYQVKLAPQTTAISSKSEQRALIRDIAEDSSSVGSGEAGVATSEPPLYYALETIPYAMGDGNVLTQLELMRLVGALLGAVTALLGFFFIREALPGVPWAATIGAACIAVQPLFGFMSGNLNPDVMLYAVSAGLLLCLARGFRRGLTRRLAIIIGVLIATGFVTKLNFVGLAPGVFFGLMLLGVRDARAKRPQALQSLAIASGIGVLPVLLYVVVNGISHHPALGSAAGGTLASNGSLLDEISYVWELYLPRLPGMTHYFQGISTFRDIWFTRSVGLYGWIDTEFPEWVDNVALIPAVAIVLLCGRTLIVKRRALRSRLPELSTYAAMSIGVLLIVGIASYLSSLATEGVEGFGDPRYLLTMLPLLGGMVTLAIRGVTPRWARSAAAVILVLFLAHDLFSQLQVVARYYG